MNSLLLIAEAIEERIEYTKGATGVKTTAIEAWEQKAGVCQDHAHVMLSAARAIGLPLGMLVVTCRVKVMLVRQHTPGLKFG